MTKRYLVTASDKNGSDVYEHRIVSDEDVALEDIGKDIRDEYVDSVVVIVAEIVKVLNHK